MSRFNMSCVVYIWRKQSINLLVRNLQSDTSFVCLPAQIEQQQRHRFPDDYYQLGSKFHISHFYRIEHRKQSKAKPRQNKL